MTLQPPRGLSGQSSPFSWLWCPLYIVRWKGGTLECRCISSSLLFRRSDLEMWFHTTTRYVKSTWLWQWSLIGSLQNQEWMNEWMNEWMSEWMDGPWVDESMDERMGGWMEGLVVDRWMDEWLEWRDGWTMNEWLDEWMGGLWMDESMDERMDRWMDGWVGGWMDEWMIWMEG